MENEYGPMFKRLMSERNELRKYIMDICNLLYIDTSQSILGSNCLEFYAVLCSTAENKIRGLQEQLKHKEQECEKLKKRLESFQKDYSKLYQVVENKDYIKELDQYKQALDIIEEYCMQCNLRWDFTAQIVLDIINKTKEK